VSRDGELQPQSGQPELRASHEDRDRVVELLRVAAGDGRLTPEELDERLEAALTARTYNELAVLTVDLPAIPDQAGGRGRAAGAVSLPEAKDLVKINVTSGTAKRDGHWVVPQRMEVRVNSGHVKLDLTKAEIVHPTLQIDAEVKSGSLVLVTRPGVVVDTDDMAVRSGEAKVKAHRGPAVPVMLRVQISGHVGSGSFKARPRRRTFIEWLLRRPPY
jgi:Domain of unknown function (DUF1707)